MAIGRYGSLPATPTTPSGPIAHCKPAEVGSVGRRILRPLSDVLVIAVQTIGVVRTFDADLMIAANWSMLPESRETLYPLQGQRNDKKQ